MDNFPILSIQYFISLIFFLISIYISWYLPGRFVLRNYVPNKITHSLLAFVVGMVLWGVQGYILGYLHLRFLTYLYIVFFLLFYIRSHVVFVTDLLHTAKRSVQDNKLISSLIGIGVCLQLLPVAGSGFLYQDGVHFYGVNAIDGVMHLGFITSIVKEFPPVQPGAYDHALTNYHYWSDLIIAELARVWRLPIAHLFFQFTPAILSLFMGIAGYKVMRIFGFSKTAGVWSIFFIYFAGDATYLLLYLVNQTFHFVTPAIDNGITQFLNMPHSMAKVVFLTSLIPFHYWLGSRQLFWGILTILFFSVMVGIKVYFGLFAIFGFGLVIFIKLAQRFFAEVKTKNLLESFKASIFYEKQSIVLSFVLLLSAALIYLPPNKSSGGLGYYPLEWAKIFIGPGVLNWGDWWLRHQVYDAHNNIRGKLFLDTIAVIITLICVHGTRLIGLVPSKSLYKKLGIEKILFFVPGAIIFHILGMFTLQQSGGFNVFNFFVVATVILSLFSAVVLEHIGFHKKNVFVWLLTIIIITITIPRVAYETYAYGTKYINKDVSAIKQEELDAFTFIRNNTPPDSIVQSHPLNPYDRQTPYVSYFSYRLTYLSGVGMQETHNQPLDKKKKVLDDLFLKTDHPQTFTTNATRLGVDYIYMRKVADEKLPFSIDTNLMKPVFENKAVVIYKLQL
jgi:hypothetical protein